MPRVESTKTALGAAGTWDTGQLQTGLADRVTGTVFADQAGTLFIEQSFDGTNYDLSKSVAVLASAGQGFSEEIVAPYLRVRYVNGATPQTVFRVYMRMSSAGSR
jgi:hypothetical protein